MYIGIVLQSTALSASGHQQYVEALLSMLPVVAAQHQFTVFTDEPSFIALPSSMKVHKIVFPATYFGLKRLYSRTLPALIKREDIETLISINYTPANLSVPYLPIVLSPSKALEACTTWLRFLYKRFLAKQLQKVPAIAVVSKQQILELQKSFGVTETRLFATGYAVPASYQPIDDWQQREQFLQQQTGGREYFLCTGSFDKERFLHLLKAFSLFKKRQQSNMQLLMPVTVEPGKKFVEKLDSYKYRQDVRLLNQPDENLLPPLIACSYAILFIEACGATAYPIATALQCAVPVIGLKSNEAVKEIAGITALYADAPVESLADQMKQLYKDETLRQQLVFAARQQAAKVNGREAALSILNRIGAIS